jgi:hypothetical protein
MRSLIALLLSLVLATQISSHDCQHDELSRNTTKHYLNDLTDARLLQTNNIGKYKIIYIDYAFMLTIPKSQ